MKIIDLLVKIANSEEVPNKIKIGNDIYWFDINDSQYTRFANNDLGKPFGLLEDMDLHNAYVWFNLDVEIIEDKHKKIELLEINKDTGDNYYIVDFETRRHIYFGTDECEQKIIEQQNNIAKAINYLLEKSDKDEK